MQVAIVLSILHIVEVITSLHCWSLHSIVRRVSYRINTCTWALSRITHLFATRIRAVFLNNTLAYIARVQFKNNERCAHVIYLENLRRAVVYSTLYIPRERILMKILPVIPSSFFIIYKLWSFKKDEFAIVTATNLQKGLMLAVINQDSFMIDSFMMDSFMVDFIPLRRSKV